jgi:hypothetical protein
LTPAAASGAGHAAEADPGTGAASTCIGSSLSQYSFTTSCHLVSPSGCASVRVKPSLFISDEMRRDWAANREELLGVWRSSKTMVEAYPADCLPWLPFRGHPGTMPWASWHLD